MNTAESLRAAYNLEHADSLQGLIIDDTVNKAVGEYFEHAEHGKRTPLSLSRFAGLVVMRNSLEVLNDMSGDISGFNKDGFSDGISVSATGLARVALLPQYADLATSLADMYDEHGPDNEKARIENTMLGVVGNISSRQMGGQQTAELFANWTTQFPLLDRVRLGVELPSSHTDNEDYLEGYYEGTLFWPAALATYALSEEMREQFGDIPIGPNDV